MKHGLITIAAVALVGCGPSVGIQQAAREEAGVSADLLPGQGSGVDLICLKPPRFHYLWCRTRKSVSEKKRLKITDKNQMELQITVG